MDESDLKCVIDSPAVLRPDGLVIKCGRGGDLVVANVTVFHAERLQAVVGVGRPGNVQICHTEARDSRFQIRSKDIG